ncbi:MAG TPA: (Fe-S)-binding protein [Micromonosporaceae bacterium]
MRVGLFLTCFNDTLFPQVGRATATVLERLGVSVDFPVAQTCCGQMHFNSGYRAECVPMVDRFTRAFESYDAIVTPSASCAAMVRHYHPTVAGIAGGDLPARVEHTLPRVYELTEFLTDVLGVTDVGASFPYPVAFHPTCHSLRLLHVGDRPQRLLREVRGLTLVDLPRARSCCGFGGTFAVKNPDTSVAMGDDKVRDVLSTDAPVLTAVDTSCLMHIGGRLSRLGAKVRVMHLAEILTHTDGRSS